MTRSASAHLVVLGMMGRAPFAGVAWQVLHYLEGVRRLGHDVYYVEDTGSWPYDPEQNTVTDDAGYAIRYIGGLMEWAGLRDRWAYVAPDGVAHGPLATRLDEVLAHADVLLNLTGATVLREEHLRVPTRIYLETDPVKPQIEVARGEEFTIDLLSAHTHHFSFGEGRQAEVFRSSHRYIWPAELDLMAQLAGFELETRHADWSGADFTAGSGSHVSVYRLPTASSAA